MALTERVADRAAFWAEVGAVSAPVLLSRVGRLLDEASAEDPELRAALQLAAAHVDRKCLVWGNGDEDDACHYESDAQPLDQSDVCGDRSISQHAPSQFGTWGVMGFWRASAINHKWNLWDEDDLHPTVDSSDASDTTETDPRVSAWERLRVKLSKSLPFPIPWCAIWLLPGVGNLFVHTVWMLGLALAIPVILWQSGQEGFNDPFEVTGISDNVGPMIDKILAWKLLLFLFLLIMTRRLVFNEKLSAALNADLDSPRGRSTIRFLRRALIVATLNMLFSGWVEFHRFNFYKDLYSKFAAVRGLILVSSGFTFLVLYKVCANMILNLQEAVANPVMTPQFWRHMTRRYLATTELIDTLWRKSGFSTAIVVIFAFNLLNGAVFSAMGVAGFLQSGYVGTWRPFCWAFNQVVVVLIGLYFMAEIPSMCASHRNGKHSLLHLARLHLGNVPACCYQEYQAFVQSVEDVPCGVEIAVLPVVTFAFVAPIVRVAVAVMPLVAGVAFKLAHDADAAAAHAAAS